ncbi:type II toxin-antitoxin system Phd/YefM family antitoxin [Patescibacteria group bacterium]
MLQTVSIVKARSNFSDLLGQAYYGGKNFLIKKLGRPFAVLVGVKEYRRLSQAREFFFQEVASQRKQNKDISLSQVKRDVLKAVSAVRKKKLGQK